MQFKLFITLLIATIINIGYSFIWKGEYFWGNTTAFNERFDELRRISSVSKVANEFGPDAIKGLSLNINNLHQFRLNNYGYSYIGYPVNLMSNGFDGDRKIAVVDIFKFQAQLHDGYGWAGVPEIKSIISMNSKCIEDISFVKTHTRTPRLAKNEVISFQNCKIHFIVRPQQKKNITEKSIKKTYQALEELGYSDPKFLSNKVWSKESAFRLISPLRCDKNVCEFKYFVHNSALYGIVNSKIIFSSDIVSFDNFFTPLPYILKS